MKQIFLRIAFGLVVVNLGYAQIAGVFTYHNDNARTALNSQETVLTTANVNSTQFGKLSSYPLDGYVHAQPLYVANVTIPGQGTHNVLYVATENDSIYAFDADNKSSKPLWHRSFVDRARRITPVPCKDIEIFYSHCDLKDPNAPVGVVSTPVIDPSSNTMYLDARTKENGVHFHRLHALDIATGEEKFGGPIAITASVPGTGEGSKHGVLDFNPLRQNNRPALLLLNGVVYVAYASRGDIHPYHGWLLGYAPDANGKLAQVAVFNTTPNAGKLNCNASEGGGGIWAAGAVSADSNSNIFLGTGQGFFDTASGNYGDSFLKLGTNGGLQLLDYFTPFTQAKMDCRDWDAGSGGTLILPDQTGTSHPHLLVVGTKEGESDSKYFPQGRIYLLDRDQMGKFNPKKDEIAQELNGISGLIFNSPAYWNQNVYINGNQKPLQCFGLKNGLLSTSPVSQTSDTFADSGVNPTASSNGLTNGIVWVLGHVVSTTSSNQLVAYDATNLATELYDSNQIPARDAINGLTKHSSATVANGRVYFASSDLNDLRSTLFVFGPLN